MNEKIFFYHLLSIDLESWVNSINISKDRLSIRELRKLDNGYVPIALSYLLDELKQHNQKITFFVVFNLEELYPGLIEKILKAGHEVGWHGHTHAFISSKAILEKELNLSKKYLKKYKVIGYQAPRIQFIREGYSLLKEYGFTYSSSIYGDSKQTYNIDGIYEIPVSVSNKNYEPNINQLSFPSKLSFLNILKFGIPFGSSYFWSILGEKYYDKKLKEAERVHRVTTMFVHNGQLMKAVSMDKKYTPDWEIPFFKNPLFYPYTRNVRNMFENLLSKYTFKRYSDYVRCNIGNQA